MEEPCHTFSILSTSCSLYGDGVNVSYNGYVNPTNSLGCPWLQLHANQYPHELFFTSSSYVRMKLTQIPTYVCSTNSQDLS
jgi:hypothetical protein